MASHTKSRIGTRMLLLSSACVLKESSGSETGFFSVPQMWQSWVNLSWRIREPVDNNATNTRLKVRKKVHTQSVMENLIDYLLDLRLARRIERGHTTGQNIWRKKSAPAIIWNFQGCWVSSPDWLISRRGREINSINADVLRRWRRAMMMPDACEIFVDFRFTRKQIRSMRDFTRISRKQ